MKVAKETRNQIAVMLVTGLVTVGVAFGAQWLFDKCFVEQKKPFEQLGANKVNNLDSLYMYNLQNQR